VLENIAHNLQASQHAFILQDAARFQKVELGFAAPNYLEPLLPEQLPPFAQTKCLHSDVNLLRHLRFDLSTLSLRYPVGPETQLMNPVLPTYAKEPSCF